MSLYRPINKIKYPDDPNNKVYLELFLKLIEIRDALNYIDNLPIIPSHADQIRKEEKIRAIRGTTGIEGNVLNEEQIKILLDTQKSKISINELETINSENVHNFIMEFCTKNDGEPISEPVIKQIHVLNTKDVPHPNNIPGQYRNFPVEYGYPVKKTPLKTAGDIEKEMASLIDWLNDEKSISFPYEEWIVKGILTHYAISRIHPFAEGNGRTARAVEALIFCHKAKINDYCFYGIANYCYQHRNRYIDELSRVDSSGDATDFLMFCVTGFLESINYVKEKVTAIISELVFMDYVRELQKIGDLSRKAVEVLEAIVKMKEIAISDYYKIFFTDRSGESKRQYLKKYEQFNLIKKKSQDKEIILSANLNMLKRLRRILD